MPTSGLGQCDWEKKKVSPLTMMCPTTARRRPIFDPKQKVADVCPWSVKSGIRKGESTYYDVYLPYDGLTSADF